MANSQLAKILAPTKSQRASNGVRMPFGAMVSQSAARPALTGYCQVSDGFANPSNDSRSAAHAGCR
jgi:hypothetical protein